MKKQRISRRQFLIGTTTVLGGAALSRLARINDERAQASLATPEPYVFLPFFASSPASYEGRVVHIRSQNATHWQGETAYWEHLDQAVVDSMVDHGVMELTGASTVQDAWHRIIPNYQSGEKVAIKVNFNNNQICSNTNTVIDALIEPVNAVVRSLEQIGVAHADVCVYDAIRSMPDRFANRGLAGIRFYDNRCRNVVAFNKTPETRIQFYPPPGVNVGSAYVNNVLMNAKYLINMPIMKGGHPIAGVTLGFKNNFGTVDNPGGMHTGVDVVDKPPGYRMDYNPLVDLNRSPLIGGKRVLTIGDALFAARQFSQAPVPWSTFGNQLPNSLFFAIDPVAVDCVMHDFVAAEPGTSIPSGANNYLSLASAAGMGVFESVNPWSGAYAQIDYRFVEL